MKTIIKTGLLAAALLCTTLMAQAQKFGYLNSALILKDMPEMRELRSSLEARQNILKKDGEAKIAQLQQKAQTAEQKKARGEMTPKEEEQVTAELQQMQEEIYSYSQKAEHEISEKQAEGMEPILQKVNDAIQAVATAAPKPPSASATLPPKIHGVRRPPTSEPQPMRGRVSCTA